MCIGEYYEHKADQCDRLAVAAVDPIIHAKYESEAILWREIARDHYEGKSANEDRRQGLLRMAETGTARRVIARHR